MAIEFHCEHCNHLIKAPDDSGGRTGKCPHCHNATYIPSKIKEDEGELDLAPLDDDEENRRKKAAMEDAAYQRSLLHERAVPGEKGGGKPGPGAKPGAPSSFVSPTKVVANLVVNYVEAMSTGKLEKADAYANELAQQKSTTLTILDEMAREDTSAYGLPPLPKPVLMGFLKQLRQRL